MRAELKLNLFSHNSAQANTKLADVSQATNTSVSAALNQDSVAAISETTDWLHPHQHQPPHPSGPLRCPGD